MASKGRKLGSAKRTKVKREHNNKTLWHRVLGKWLELLLTRVDIIVYTEPQIMSEPPKVDILLLRRNTPTWTPTQLRFLPDGICDSIAGHVLIEFKFTESLNRARFQQALGYDYFYRQAQQLPQAAVQTVILAAITPRPAFLQEYGYQVAEQSGVYRSVNPMLQSILLIVLNELRPELHNTFVQCFASRGHVRRAAFQRLEAMNWQELDEAFWDFFVGLQQQYVEKGKEESIMRKREAITPETVMESGRQLRQSLLAVLTPEERLAGLAPEERLAGLAPEERLAGLAPEERLAGVAPEERLAGLTPEELRHALEKNEQARREAVALATPAERLSGLTPAEMLALMKQIEAHLQQEQENAPGNDPKTDAQQPA